MNKKHSAVVRLILFSVIAVVLVGVLAWGIGGKPLLRHIKTSVVSQNSVTLAEGTPIRASDVDELEISWVAGNVRIVPGTQEEITVTEELLNSDHPMILRQDGSRLVVDFCESSWYTSLSVPKKNLTVTLPAGWSGKRLKVNLVSAGLTCSDTAFEQLELSTVSGAYTFQRCGAGDMKVESVSGNLNFTGTLRQLKFDGVSARVNLTTQEAPERIQMNSISGDLELTLPAGCGFTLNNSSLSGRLDTDFPTTEQGGSTISGNGACQIELNGVSAGVHIRQGEQ